MKKAFTLAEVLITLTIIGVIAALTIPNLSRKWSDHADVQKVKEAYSILSNALKMAVAENGPVNEWQEDKPTILSKYLRVDKTCSGNTGTGAIANQSCSNSGWNITTRQYSTKWPPGNWYYTKALHGATFAEGETTYNRIFLKNGMSVLFWGQQDGYYFIVVDINGVQKPARKGYDWFFFAYDNEKMLGKIPNWYGESAYCSTTNSVTHYIWDGFSCSNWVLKHGNMDYKYRDVSAEW